MHVMWRILCWEYKLWFILGNSTWCCRWWYVTWYFRMCDHELWLVAVEPQVVAYGNKCYLKVIIKVCKSWMNMVPRHDSDCIKNDSQGRFSN